jgi:Domain of unknown function (DUF4279)
VTFIIHSEVHTGDEITARMGLEPTTVAEKGDPVSRRYPDRARRRHTTWQLAGGLSDDAEPAAHLEALLPLVEPRTSALSDMRSAGATASWSCFVTAKPTGNMIQFEPGLLARLSEVGALLEFDIYDSDDSDD